MKIKTRPNYQYEAIVHQYNTCPKCEHKYIETGDNFCKNCGVNLTWPYTHYQALMAVHWQEEQTQKELKEFNEDMEKIEELKNKWR